MMIDEGGGDQMILFAIINDNLFVVYNRCSFVLAFVRMWLINIRFHISQSKERGRDKLSLFAIIKSKLYLSGPANGLNYFVLTSEALFYGQGKLAALVSNVMSVVLLVYCI